MKRKGKRGQRLLIALLCLALCAADIMPVSMTVWASEQTLQSTAADGSMPDSIGEEENDISVGNSGSDPQDQEADSNREEADANEGNNNNVDQDQNDADKGKDDSEGDGGSNDSGNQGSSDDEKDSEDQGTLEDTGDSDAEESDEDLEDSDSDSEESEDNSGEEEFEEATEENEEESDEAAEEPEGKVKKINTLQALEAGNTFEIDYVIYEVISETDRTVKVQGVDRANFNNNHEYGVEFTVPASIESGGITYSVTEIGEYAFADYTCNGTPSDDRMFDMHIDNDYSGLYISKVIVSPGITKIDKGAFYKSARISEVVLPNTVAEIGEAAFYFDEQIRNNGYYYNPLTVNIPASVKTIGDYAYHGVHFDRTLKIPNGVETIGYYAFACATEASGIYAVYIPESVTYINMYAFDNATLMVVAFERTEITNNGNGFYYSLVMFGDYHEKPEPAKLTFYVPEVSMSTYTERFVYYRPSLEVRNLDEYIELQESPVRFLYRGEEITDKLVVTVSTEEMSISKRVTIDTGDSDLRFTDINWSFKRYGTSAELTDDELSAYLTYTVNDVDETISFTGVSVGNITVTATADGYLSKSFNIGIIEGYSNEDFLAEVQSFTSEDIARMKEITYADKIAHELEAVRDKTLEITAGCANDYDKIKAVHTWLADNIAYNHDFLRYCETGGDESVPYAVCTFSAYEVLMNRFTVCGGFARLAEAMLRSIGIPCAVVSGYATGDFYDNNRIGHGWNMAYDSDEHRWIYFDSTWDSVGAVRNFNISSVSADGDRQLSWFDFDAEKTMADGREFRAGNFEEVYSDGYWDFCELDMITLFVGEEGSFQQLTSDEEVTFTLSNGFAGTDIIEVDEQGNVKALKPGAVEIDARLVSPATGQTTLFAVSVFVLDKTSFEFEKTNLVVGMKDDPEYRRVSCPLNGNYVNPFVKLTSDHPNVVDVEPDGTLNIKNTGTATITAKLFISAAEEKTVTSCTVTVIEGKSIGDDGQFQYRILSEPSGSQNGMVEIVDSMLGKLDTSSTNRITTLVIPKSTDLYGKKYDVIGIGTKGLSGHLQSDDIMTYVSEIVFPDTIQYIGKGAFSGNEYLSKVDLSNCSLLKTIGDEAFYNCGSKSLSGEEASLEIKLPAGLTTIGDYAFAGTGLTGTVDISGAFSIGRGIFASCDGIEAVILSDDLKEIPDETFCGAAGLRNVCSKSRLDEAGGIEGLQDGAVLFTDDITRIGKSAFNGCESIQSVEACGVKELGDTAFISCSKMETIALSNELTVIPYEAFGGCRVLDGFDFDEIEVIGDFAFFACNKLGQSTGGAIELGRYLKTIGNNAFYECYSVSKVTSYSKIIENIGSYCFSGYPYPALYIYKLSSGIYEKALGDCVSKIVYLSDKPDDDIAYGKSNNIKWAIDYTGKLTVTGSGDFTRKNNMPPWSEYASSIKSAQIDVTGMRNASYLFYDCSSLTDVDLSDFSTGNITNMSYMFYKCQSLEQLDVDEWDTGKVTNMRYMFSYCSSLKTLNVREWNTANVTDMSFMFDMGNSGSLTTLDLGKWNTGKVTNMRYMFGGNTSLKTMNLSSFTAGKVKNMESMFSHCRSLTDLDLSGWDTGAVVSMYNMFDTCSSLTDLNLSGWDTGAVTDMHAMFRNCASLESLDLSSLETGKVEDVQYIFYGCSSLKELNIGNWDVGTVKAAQNMLVYCSGLEVICAPLHLQVPVDLPGVWYRADNGEELTKLPLNLSTSVLLVKNEQAVGQSFILATKVKTYYLCGDKIDTDDITVTYYSSKGTVRKLSKGDYNVDTDAIDMSVPGIKELVITYVEPETNTELRTTIELFVTNAQPMKDVMITLREGRLVYNGHPQRPKPIVSVLTGGSDNADQTSATKTLVEGTDYTVSYDSEYHINAGEIVKVIVTGTGNFSGTVSETFEINKADLTVQAGDVTLAVGDELPKPASFPYEVIGLVTGDRLEVVGCDFTDWDDKPVDRAAVSTSETGIYYVTLQVDAGNNYTMVESRKGKLTIAEERVAYTVTFDMMNHGKDIDPNTGIKAGSLITEPPTPTAEGYVFAGWYKDTTFAAKQKWNFDTDTVQADTILYACWIEKGAEGNTGLQFSIQDIQDQYYTGSAIKPTVYVYTADGKTLLKSGKDYTIKYENNSNAGEARVIITGKGNYTESIDKNFRILPAKISTDGENVAAGFTLKYSDQLVTNVKKVQNPFSSLKYKKAMKLGKDYMITLEAGDDVECDKNIILGEDEDWIKKGKPATTVQSANGKNYIAPTIPKGYSGTFIMKVEGVNNYKGSFTKEVRVTDKNHLMKNASVSLGKNIKSWSYDETEGKEVILTPGYCETITEGNKKKTYYYEVDRSGNRTEEKDVKDIFLVKAGGKYLKYGVDYKVRYTNNKAVGTATMTIEGMGDYMGTKSVSFKIKGTAFNTKNVVVKTYDAQKAGEQESAFVTPVSYTGKAITQNTVLLTNTIEEGTEGHKRFEYGTDYTISYKNNIKKGTATMTFTARPESGYTGSFKKTFKITQQNLSAVTPDVDIIEATIIGSGDSRTKRLKVKDEVPYVKGGVKPSDRIVLINTEGLPLKEGTDYIVKYKYNTTVTTSNTEEAKKPYMTVTGKGNYTGSLTVYFDIKRAELSEEQITVSQIAWNENAKDTYEYKPGVKVVDSISGMALSIGAAKDYEIRYEANGQENVTKYVKGEAGAVQPKAVITVPDNSSYKLAVDQKEIEIMLPIYEIKLTGSNLYVVISKDNFQTTYTGKQVTPKVTVYYGKDPAAVKAAKKKGIENEAELTNPNGDYKLIKLAGPPTASDEEADTLPVGTGGYTITYGANNAAGKNKGSVTITGAGTYGGSVTVKFEILKRNVNYTT